MSQAEKREEQRVQQKAEQRQEQAERTLDADERRAGREHRRRTVGFWLVVAVAAALAVAFGLDLFAMPGDLVRAASDLSSSQSEDAAASQSADASQSASASSTEAANDDAASSGDTYRVPGIAVDKPAGWKVVDSGQVRGLQAPDGVGYVQLSEQNASTMTMGGNVDGEQAMRGFVATMICSEHLSADADQVSITQGPDGFWRASLPLSQDVDGTSCRGVQLLAGDGADAYVVTALCPDSSYDADWPTYQHILDSAVFEAEA